MIINPEYLASSGTEHGEQMALFCWANMARIQGFDVANDMNAYGKAMQFNIDKLSIPQLEWMYAIPNGGGRTAAEGGRLKAEGVKGGVADVCLPCPGSFSRDGQHVQKVEHLFPGLYIEMKKRDGVPSNVTDEQIKFARYVIQNHYHWQVCFGWQEAAVVIMAYLTGTSYTMSDKQNKVYNKVLERL